MKPGELMVGAGAVEINAGRKRIVVDAEPVTAHEPIV